MSGGAGTGEPVPVAGNVVKHTYLFRDAAGNPKAGFNAPADVTFLLFKDNAAASEAIPSSASGTFYDIPGRPGYYGVEYTPSGGGQYSLYLQEIAADSQLRGWSWADEIVSAGSVFLPSFANAFCSESDVESWAGFSFESGSKPSSDQVAGFAQSRASEMRSIFSAEGWVVGPTTVTPGGAEEDMLRACNAIGAAADAWMSKFMDTDPARTEKATQLLEEYQTRLERLQAYAAKVAGSAHLLRTPMTSGEVTLADETPIQDVGLRDAIRMDQEF